MPRNGAGVFSKPPGTTAVTGTKIEAAKFNTVIDDLVTDANAKRPVTAGGTGGSSVAEARTNLAVDPKRKVVHLSANYTAVADDNRAIFHCETDLTLSISAMALLATDWNIMIVTYGGEVTIDPSGSETINGGSSLKIPAGQQVTVYYDGAGFLCALPKIIKIDTSYESAGLSTTTTTDQAAALSSTVNFTPTSPTSKLFVQAIVYASVTKGSDSIDDLGGEMIIKRYDGSSYQNTSGYSIMTNTNIGSNGSRTIYGSLAMAVELPASARRSDSDRWSVRLYGNVVYSGNTLTIPRVTWLFMEYE